MPRRFPAIPPALVSGCLVALTCLGATAVIPDGPELGLLQLPSVNDVQVEVAPEPEPEPVGLPSSQRQQSDTAAAEPPRAPVRERSAAPRASPSDVLGRIGGPEIWSGNLETADRSQFLEAPWEVVDADEPEVVTGPTRAGDYALRVSIPAGATTDSYGNRSEVVPDIPKLLPGDTYVFGVSMYLEQGFPIDDAWQVVTQWKSPVDGSPPIELNVEHGEFGLCGGEGHPEDAGHFCKSLGVAETGRWIDWVFLITFALDSDSSSIQVWRDGREALAPFSPPGGTLYPDDDGGSGYWKVGYYRKSGISAEGTVYYDNVTLRSVRD